MRLFNEALLGKLLWRFGFERDAFWRQVIEVNYGFVWGGWCIGFVASPYVVSLWKNISQGWPSLSCYILYEIGDGSRVKFWYDRWCGETPLAVSYPELFRICQDKEVSVAELKKFHNGVLHWDISFLRDVNNWEVEAYSSSIVTIYGSFVRGEGLGRIKFVGN